MQDHHIQLNMTVHKLEMLNRIEGMRGRVKWWL